MAEPSSPLVSTLDETPSFDLGPLRPQGSDRAADELRKAARRRALFGSAAEPAQLGRYVVLERVGAGGMGEVFAARDDELDRRVAIKVVHAELARESPAASARLLREAQVLAKLTHPNVVHVYEVGLLQDRVYIVMEFVSGRTLRQRMDAGIGWQQALDLLMQAGRGLAAIHAAGLVHRDVKPENILVGDDGRVRVADFGLARAVGPHTAPSRISDSDVSLISDVVAAVGSHQTASGALVGTPVYMAPEQLRQVTVDARGDQFSFCVTAWEALAGHRPFPGGSLPELVHAHSQGPNLPPRGSGVPHRVWRALRRGLDPDAHRRHPDLAALLEAIDPRRGLRSAKWWALGTGIAIASSTALVMQGSAPCRGLEVTAWDDAARSEVAEGLHRASPSFGASVLPALERVLDDRAAAIASARRDACEATRVRGTQSAALLDRRVACIERAAHRLDALVGALAAADVEASARALEAAQAVPDAELCDAEHLRGTTDPPTSRDAEARIAALERRIDDAWAEWSLGHAARLEGDLVELRRAAADLGHEPSLAEVAFLVGNVARSLGDPSTARAQLLDAADLAEASHHDVLAARAWATLVRLAYEDLKDPEAAEGWLRRATVASARAGLADDLEIRLLRAHVRRVAGRLADARTEVDALAVAAPNDLDVLRARVVIAEWRGELDSAEALARRYEERIAAELGPEHPHTASARFNVGELQARRGDLETARASIESAVEIWTAAYGPEHLDIALAHAVLTMIDLQSGRLGPARRHAEACLAIRRDALSADHPDVAAAWVALASVDFLAGRYDEAARAQAAALAIEEAAFGALHPDTIVARANLAEAELARGEVARALEIATRAAEDAEGAEDMDPALVAFAERVLGSALHRSGDDARALEMLRRAERRVGDDDSDPVEAAALQTELARVLATRPGELDRARRAADHARGILDALPPDFARARLADLDALQLTSTEPENPP